MKKPLSSSKLRHSSGISGQHYVYMLERFILRFPRLSVIFASHDSLWYDSPIRNIAVSSCQTVCWGGILVFLVAYFCLLTCSGAYEVSPIGKVDVGDYLYILYALTNTLRLLIYLVRHSASFLKPIKLLGKVYHCWISARDFWKIRPTCDKPSSPSSMIFLSSTNMR